MQPDVSGTLRQELQKHRPQKGETNHLAPLFLIVFSMLR